MRRLAIIKGNAAFLAPLMGMVPFKRWPPTMRIRSMTLLLPRAPAPVSSRCEDPRLRGPPDPCQAATNTPIYSCGLTLSPLITIPMGLSGLGLGLAFQQIRPELGLEPGPAGRLFRVLTGLVLGVSAHRCRHSTGTAFISCQHLGGGSRPSPCMALPRYGRVAPGKRAFRGAGCRLRNLDRSLSRRSSVVEHVIGNDGVGSSILPDGTSYHQTFSHLMNLS